MHMLGKKSKPVIGMLTGTIVSGNKSGMVDAMTSRTHVQPAVQPPKGLKCFDLGGVGLGIVAALEKSGDMRGEIPAIKALFGPNMGRSNPIPVSSPRNSPRIRRDFDEMEMEMGSSEEYTIVTCHDPNMPYTKVYCDKSPFRIRNSAKSKKATVFHISPARCPEVSGIPAADFLSSCDMCQKKLHGKDIYMYRGDKAFCSTECRYKQIAMDERQEKCSWEASRPVDASSSPLANGQIFTTGILAT